MARMVPKRKIMWSAAACRRLAIAAQHRISCEGLRFVRRQLRRGKPGLAKAEANSRTRYKSRQVVRLAMPLEGRTALLSSATCEESRNGHKQDRAHRGGC